MKQRPSATTKRTPTGLGVQGAQSLQELPAEAGRPRGPLAQQGRVPQSRPVTLDDDHAFRDHRPLFSALCKQTLRPQSPSFSAPFSQVLKLIIPGRKGLRTAETSHFRRQSSLSALYTCPWESKGDLLGPGSVIMGNVGAELRSTLALVRGRLPAVAELRASETSSRDLPWPAASGTRT